MSVRRLKYGRLKARGPSCYWDVAGAVNAAGFIGNAGLIEYLHRILKLLVCVCDVIKLLKRHGGQIVMYQRHMICFGASVHKNSLEKCRFILLLIKNVIGDKL